MANKLRRSTNFPKAAIEALWQGNVIEAIKVVRQERNIGLKEAKEVVDALPKPLKEGVSKDEADKIKAQLEEAGAVCEIVGM